MEKQYFDIKNLAIILVDFVPYERKKDMIEGLRELFETEGDKQPVFFDEPSFDSIPDIRESGILSGSGHNNLGMIFNSDIDWQPLMGIQKKLPEEFLGIQVTVGQFVDFSYWIEYLGFVKENYQNKDIKRVFVESRDFVPYRIKTPDGREMRGRKPKGPELEPTIRSFQTDLENFLRPYSCGLFLDRTTTKGTYLSCISVKVLSTQKIDFNLFKNWERQHFNFFRFIGFTHAYSRYDSMLVGYYPERIFREQSIFQGLVFLASTADFKGDGYETPEKEICYRIQFQVMDLVPLLHLIYWPSFAMEVNRRKWEQQIRSMLSDISASREKKIEDIQQAYDKTMELYRDFNQHFIEEKWNIDLMKQHLSFAKRVTSATKPLDSTLPQTNLFEDMLWVGESFLDQEKDMLQHIKDQIDLLFSYSDNLINMDLNKTNLHLQKRMDRMTYIMLVLAIVTTILALDTVWNWLQTIWDLIW